MALDITNTFTAGEPIIASEMNTNFTEVENYFNNSVPTLAGANTFTGTGTFNAAVTVNSTITTSGVFDITDTTDSSDATGDTGALRCEGGASIAKKLYVGTDLDVDGATTLDATTVAEDFTVASAGRSFFANTDDIDLDGVSGAVIIGNADGTGQHIAIDTNEIQSKSDGTTVGNLHLNILGGQVKIHAGTSSLPALAFTGDPDTGLYHAADDTIGFKGDLFMATAMPQTSTGSYATLRRFSDGSIKELTSSERFKKDITDVALSDAYKVLNARPIHYRDNNDDSSVPLEAGLSAESLHDSGWTYAVSYDEDTTTPRGIHYEMLVAPLIAIVKDLNTRLAALEG